MKIKGLLLLSLTLVLLLSGCGGSSSNGPIAGDSPTEAYKRLYAAVKAKDMETVKKQLTKRSIDFGKMAGAQNGKQGDSVYENGFTATTFSDTLPNIRDQRISGEMGAIEVWNSKDSRWEDLPFILEDGTWKLAIGDQFYGSYKSPGKGRDIIEREAANLVSNNPPPPSSNTNAIPIVNANSLPRKTK